LWNIRWMLTMQDPHDGGVYHKCTHANFSGTVMPHQATAPRYVVQKSSTATLDFSAVMAQSARIFRAFESELPGLADSCLTAALSAWRWARAHPHVYYRQSENNQKFLPAITTGEYGDRDDSDEFKWAAAELYITTKQDSFIAIVNPLSDNDTEVPGWPSVETLAFYSLAHHRKNLTSAVDTTALKNRLLQFANGIKAELSRSAYNVLINGFWWGSNSGAANQAIAMIQAFELTADSSYLDAAIANLDYLLGRNATTYCFVTGEGDKPPMHPHHRPSEADDVIDPIPGLLVGGPNPGQQDGCAGYPSDLPARSYLDDYCSYASNEICINWNAPIAYAAAAVEAIKSRSGKPNTIHVEITSPGEGDSYATSQIIPISAEAAIADGNIVKVEFYANAAKIGEADAPFVLQWTDARPGVYELQAKAVGDQGDFRYSAAVTVIVFNAESVGDLLFVVGALELNAGDRAIRDFLVQYDYHVRVQHDDDSLAFAIADVDAILLSSTCSATRKIRAELVNINVPLISWEYSLFDDFNWTGRRNNIDYGKQFGSHIEIVNSSHPLAAGLSGRIEVTAVEHELLWAMPGANATTIACLENDARPVLFCYETGNVMLNDMTAKSRQIGLYYSDESPAAFTENSWKLLLAAVEWAQAGERLNVEEKSNAPHSHQLWQNYPNPFNPETRIRYAVNEPALVSILIYNAVGQRITTLVHARQSAGDHRVVWDGRDESGAMVSAGVYLCRMIAGDFTQTSKMILLR
ncbi:glycoside hydrolase family 9 protein, partial [candidate division KSB1 bacterium]|nr:glycoside hydrolase family 9 protein [candidate division KSB1 bacterium]